MQIKFFKFLVFIAILGSSTAKAMINNEVVQERRQANAIDLVAFTIASKVINDNIFQFPSLSLAKSCIYGASAWLCGEFLEMIYKKVYKLLTHSSLREALGNFSLCGITLDNQRLLRRVITLIPLCLELYLCNRVL
jgi:hypothetical protein